MRVIAPKAYTVYLLDELEPAAREWAIDQVMARRAKDGWDGWEYRAGWAQVRNAIAHAVGVAVGDPAAEDCGPDRYPGLDGVEVEGWDFWGAPSVALEGYLTSENAPGLPWVPGIESVELASFGVLRANNTALTLHLSTRATDDTPSREEQGEMLRQAYEILFTAQQAGLTAWKDVTSREGTAASLIAGRYEFLANGILHTV